MSVTAHAPERVNLLGEHTGGLMERLEPHVWGAKMTGAGFGGAVVALVDPDQVPAIRQALADVPQLLVCRPAD